MPKDFMSDRESGHYWRLKNGEYDGTDVMQGWIAIKRAAELEAKGKHYEQFIKNGVETGNIRIPDKIDPAYFTIMELTQKDND